MLENTDAIALDKTGNDLGERLKTALKQVRTPLRRGETGSTSGRSSRPGARNAGLNQFPQILTALSII